ncbi:MAG: alpha/beta hydrolase [Rhodocyclales bacterium]|nr:alpha/beta hydrolase [Rhodocyclales bacterium]
MSATLFLIHGMWGGPWCLENYVNYFDARGYSCRATTLLYHDVPPDTPPDPRLGNTGVRDYVSALEAEIRALPDKPILIGHSMGGLFAQMLAARGLAKAVILLTPTAPAGVFALRPSIVRSFASSHLRWGFWRKPFLQTFAEAKYSMMHRLPESQHRPLYDRLVPDSGRAMVEIGHWYLDRGRSARVDAARVTCPVLAIAATEDRLTPAAVVRQVARKYGATYKEFAGHAHWIAGEPGWEEVADYIADWLQQLPKTVC